MPICCVHVGAAGSGHGAQTEETPAPGVAAWPLIDGEWRVTADQVRSAADSGADADLGGPIVDQQRPAPGFWPLRWGSGAFGPMRRRPASRPPGAGALRVPRMPPSPARLHACAPEAGSGAVPVPRTQRPVGRAGAGAVAAWASRRSAASRARGASVARCPRGRVRLGRIRGPAVGGRSSAHPGCPRCPLRTTARVPVRHLRRRKACAARPVGPGLLTLEMRRNTSRPVSVIPAGAFRGRPFTRTRRSPTGSAAPIQVQTHSFSQVRSFEREIRQGKSRRQPPRLACPVIGIAYAVNWLVRTELRS